MITNKSMVYFECHEPAAMREYCRKHNLSTPVLHSKQERGGDYYKCTHEVWEQLYLYGGYGPNGYHLAMGCYPLS